MSKFPHGGDAFGAQPSHPLLAPVLRPALELSRQQALLDLAAIQRIPGLAGYWSADPAYLWEDSGATTPASINGVVGCWESHGSPAIQATTAVKPYLRRTPTSGVYWLDSNAGASALTATLGNLGAACTVARVGAEGVTFTEGVTISSTYNIATAYNFNGNVAIFDRALTASEKALITRYMWRFVPILSGNIISNGTFDVNTAGWFSDNTGIGEGTFSVIDGVARVEVTNNYYYWAYAPITNAQNKVYYVRFDITADYVQGYIGACTQNALTAKGTDTNIFAGDAIAGPRRFTLKATTSPWYLYFQINNSTLFPLLFDNVLVNEVL